MHTRGPWRVNDRYIEGDNGVLDAVGYEVADVPYIQTRRARNGRKVNRELTPAEQIANAKLIAAAPLMAEALERITRDHVEDGSCGPDSEDKDYCDECEQARAALRAAGILPSPPAAQEEK